MKEYGRTVTVSIDAGEATVAPDAGFSLVSFRWKGIEILAAGLQADFLRVRKGLGPLILPHFNQFGYSPQVGAEDFPHVRELEHLGVQHPFQHGIGRYVPWEYHVENDQVTGRIDGSMRVKGCTFSELVGFDFTAVVIYKPGADGLDISFDIEGEKPIAAGIHFYYELFNREKARVILPSCLVDAPAELDFSESTNRIFRVGPARKDEAICTLVTEKYSLKTIFPVGSSPEESFDSLVLFSPKAANFACIEPISYAVGEENAKRSFRGTIRLVPVQEEP